MNVTFDYIGPRIAFTAHDPSAKLHENKSSEKWANTTTTDVIKDLIGRVGMVGKFDGMQNMAGKMLEQDFVKLSDNVSFAYVIHKLAERDGALVGRRAGSVLLGHSRLDRRHLLDLCRSKLDAGQVRLPAPQRRPQRAGGQGFRVDIKS
ncbi:hypothetical protein [Bradyrhizobium sp. 33ap4]|uniref:hypothetical protein n=1 Tax=Bradyrhizobium sp. 33ap4 TaxID=3061630 RepID=UPI00292F0D2F|nr:hypothetical protein [Bradyrhizobium sp. 33ap4]